MARENGLACEFCCSHPLIGRQLDQLQISITVTCRHELAESSDDEEHFQRKEAKRLARDKAKLNPLILSEPSEAAVFSQCCPI